MGCVSALIVHCVALIQAACSDANAMEEIIREDFVFGRLVGFANKKCSFDQSVLFNVLFYVRLS